MVGMAELDAHPVTLAIERRIDPEHRPILVRARRLRPPSAVLHWRHEHGIHRLADIRS
jgi:hypothetical protein